MKIVRTKENLPEAKAKHAAAQAQAEIQKQQQAQAEIQKQPQVQEERATASPTENLEGKPSVKTEEELRLQQAEYDQLKEAARLESLTPEQRCKEDWDGNSAIRAEFRKFETFLAYKTAEADGKVHIIGGRVITA